MPPVKAALFLCLLTTSCNGAPPPPLPIQEEKAPCATDTAFLRRKAEEAHQYCIAQKGDTQFFLFVDLARHSGCNRFFIWDFRGDSLLHAFPLSHGCAGNPWGQTASKEKAELSNEEGFHASAAGKYFVGARGQSAWGIGVKYLLHGKEQTNHNALRRQVVLHGWDVVADAEIYPQGTPEGWGCPAVSNNNMRLLDSLLQRAQRPVLLWVVQE